MTQRCIACLCDTPDGSPPKCKACREADAAFGTRNVNVHFVGSGRPADTIDNDPDAWGRAEEEA